MISDGGLILSNYRSYSAYSDRQVWANSVDPDQMQNAASDQSTLFTANWTCLLTFIDEKVNL